MLKSLHERGGGGVHLPGPIGVHGRSADPKPKRALMEQWKPHDVHTNSAEIEKGTIASVIGKLTRSPRLKEFSTHVRLIELNGRPSEVINVASGFDSSTMLANALDKLGIEITKKLKVIMRIARPMKWVIDGQSGNDARDKEGRVTIDTELHDGAILEPSGVTARSRLFLHIRWNAGLGERLLFVRILLERSIDLLRIDSGLRSELALELSDASMSAYLIHITGLRHRAFTENGLEVVHDLLVQGLVNVRKSELDRFNRGMKTIFFRLTESRISELKERSLTSNIVRSLVRELKARGLEKESEIPRGLELFARNGALGNVHMSKESGKVLN